MSRGVDELACSHEGGDLYIVGTGPTASDFPLKKLEGDDYLAVALNRAVDLFAPDYWLFGDPQFAKREAPVIYRRHYEAGTDDFEIVMNLSHIEHFQARTKVSSRKITTTYGFTNVVRGERLDVDRAEGKKATVRPWYTKLLFDNYLPGRWNIVTIALSFATLLSVSRVILVGVDMGRVGGRYSAAELDDCATKRKDDCMKNGIHLMERMWRTGQWSGFDIETTSPHFVANVPGVEPTLISVEEALV